VAEAHGFQGRNYIEALTGHKTDESGEGAMKFSTWNWATHPYDKTRGVCLGPFFGVWCYISTPIPKGSYGVTVQFKKTRASTCVCGDPTTPGISHRKDGPCYVNR
jgi:hypothetical protein